MSATYLPPVMMGFETIFLNIYLAGMNEETLALLAIAETHPKLTHFITTSVPAGLHNSRHGLLAVNEGDDLELNGKDGIPFVREQAAIQARGESRGAISEAAASLQSMANFCGNQHIGFPRVANSDRDFFRDEGAVWPKVGELGLAARKGLEAEFLAPTSSRVHGASSVGITTRFTRHAPKRRTTTFTARPCASPRLEPLWVAKMTALLLRPKKHFAARIAGFVDDFDGLRRLLADGEAYPSVRSDLAIAQSLPAVPTAEYSRHLQRRCPACNRLLSDGCCPMTHLLNLYRQNPQPANAPLFCLHEKPFSQQNVIQLLRNQLRRCNIAMPERYKGHSFRRGAAQTAHDNSLSEDHIKALGCSSSSQEDCRHSPSLSYLLLHLKTTTLWAQEVGPGPSLARQNWLSEITYSITPARSSLAPTPPKHATIQCPTPYTSAGDWCRYITPGVAAAYLIMDPNMRQKSDERELVSAAVGLGTSGLEFVLHSPFSPG
ncbi:uncharacterized protein BDR25DRAFT_395189 [Lindgomyces ingoldianus]|uniref:Uncharacterized protein n=1 Tax=Lindgomyces ingoldianus TaxID=673940 RepID=A0ACB6QMI6_9PLEO|nr:uncharacterized protein BDR25DRAFT_395189 [Lindgomyces ingoldianus]KAF2467740.1 hypothetical protein BDR25DRAFT_395189 [Lindgomyces ingoldianus]